MKVNFPIFNLDQNLSLSSLEVQTVTGLPELKILGIAGQEAQTLKEKLRTSLKSQRIKLKNLRKIIHFKEIDSRNVNLNQFDLQLAAMLLAQFQIINLPANLSLYFSGKLDLDGKIISAISDSQLLALTEKFPKSIFVTSAMTELNHPNILKVDELKEILNIDYFKLDPVSKAVLSPVNQPLDPEQVSFEHIEDFNLAKLALLLTLKAQGSLLLIGSSGAGKSMLFRTLPALGLQSEQISVLDPSYTIQNFKSQISSIAKNKLSKNDSSPHILILNELNDYKKSFLDYLKIFFDQIESKDFAFKFIILASLNPCPCGNYGHSEKICFCNPFQISRYQNKVAFPVLDRFDLVLDLNRIGQEHFPAVTTKDALKYLNTTNIKDLPLDKFAEYLMTVLKVEFSPSNRRCKKIEETALLIAHKKQEPVLSEESMSEAIFLNTYLLQKNV